MYSKFSFNDNDCSKRLIFRAHSGFTCEIYFNELNCSFSWVNNKELKNGYIKTGINL